MVNQKQKGGKCHKTNEMEAPNAVTNKLYITKVEEWATEAASAFCKLQQ